MSMSRLCVLCHSKKQKHNLTATSKLHLGKPTLSKPVKTVHQSPKTQSGQETHHADFMALKWGTWFISFQCSTIRCALTEHWVHAHSWSRGESNHVWLARLCNINCSCEYEQGGSLKSAQNDQSYRYQKDMAHIVLPFNATHTHTPTHAKTYPGDK